MSYQIDVALPGMADIFHGCARRVPATNFTIELDKKSKESGRYVWRLLRPIPPSIRMILGETGMGTWTHNSTGFFLYPQYESKKVAMELRQEGIDTPRGIALALPREGNRGAVLYDMEGKWTPSAQPLPKTWVGIMAKGSVGLGIGAEGGIGAVVALDWSHQGASFGYGAGRVIAGGGFSGGLALVIATGFQDGSKFDKYSSSDGDWALSFGPNLRSMLATGKFAKLTPLLKALGTIDLTLGTLEQKAAKLGDKLKTGEHTKEIYGVAKGATQACLIDTDYQNVTAIDIPLTSGGAEAGIYYSWSSYKLLSRW